MSTRVGINGFGRIGRDVLRAALGRDALETVAVNDLTDARTLAHLLKYDSVGGIFDADVRAKDGALTVNGHAITVLAERDPAKLPLSHHGHTAPSKKPQTATILMGAPCSPAPWWGAPAVFLCRHVTGTALALSRDC